MKTQLLLATVLFSTCAFAQDKAEPELPSLNTKTSMDASCVAGTRIEDTKAPGGFAPSDNAPRSIGNLKVEKNKFYLWAKPEQSVTFAGKYKGMTLCLINTSSSTRTLAASDSRLFLIQEAKDEHGVWRPIERLPWSGCGNSYHKVFLGTNEFWSFSVPRYDGPFKTKLRFRLWETIFFPGMEAKPSRLSNEFEGGINPEQLGQPIGEPQISTTPPPTGTAPAK